MVKFEAIHDILDKAKSMSESKAWTFAIDQKTKQYIISLNTNEQLGEDGIDAQGRSLGEYTPFTVNFRRSKGLQVDHIDFKVTGQYWRSWKVEVKADQLIIRTDEERFNELVTLLRFSPDHVGLTDDNLQLVIGMIRSKYIDYVNGILQGD